jgi:hypothetical protein
MTKTISMSSSTPIQDAWQPLEFTEGGHVVTISPLGPKARVEISLRGLALADPTPYGEALLLLHRLNAAARGAHPWIVSIDDEDILLLGAVFPSSDKQTLATHVAEGIARAKALDSLWQTAREGRRPPASLEQEWAAPLNPLHFA